MWVKTCALVLVLFCLVKYIYVFFPEGTEQYGSVARSHYAFSLSVRPYSLLQYSPDGRKDNTLNINFCHYLWTEKIIITNSTLLTIKTVDTIGQQVKDTYNIFYHEIYS